MLHLEQLKQEWSKDCQIDSDHLDESAIRTANLHQKYLDILTEYKLRIFKLEKEFLTMKGIRAKYYMGQMSKDELLEYEWEQYQFKTPLKSELERLLETDTILLNIQDKQSYINFCFEYVGEVMKSLKDRVWQIRAAIDWKKFESGN